MTQTLIPQSSFQDHPTREAWLAARRNYIGSSEAAAILGVNTWNSPYSVWHDKTTTEAVDTSSPNDEAEWGLRLEQPIADKFNEVVGCQLHDPGEFALYESADYPWLACTPDRLWNTDAGLLRAVVELKTAHFKQGSIWGERVPESYMVQVQQQMLVLGVDEAYIAVLVDGYQFRYHTIAPHKRMQNLIVNKTREFWHEYVLTGIAPPTDYSQATRQALAERYPTAKPAIVDIDDELLGPRYDKLTRLATRIGNAKSEIQNFIKESIGQAEYARLGDDSGFSWKQSKNGRRTFRRVERVYDYDDN